RPGGHAAHGRRRAGALGRTGDLVARRRGPAHRPMRLAWLSPAAGNSGIVEFSREVLPAVGRYAEPELWSHGPPDSTPPGIPVVDYASDPEALGRLASY